MINVKHCVLRVATNDRLLSGVLVSLLFGGSFLDITIGHQPPTTPASSLQCPSRLPANWDNCRP